MSEFADRFWSSADGLRLYARDYPATGGQAAGLPVVCLHGLTRNSRDFEAVAPWIAARGRRVLVPDVRGRGRSAHDPNPMDYALPVYVGDVVSMLAGLGVSRAVFVGTSMGGLITLGLAAVAPQAVAGAVLNDVGPEVSAAGLARITAYVGAEGPKARSWAEAVAYARATNGAAFPDYAEADWAAMARRIFREQGGAFVLDYDPAIMVPIGLPAEGPAPDLWPLFLALATGRPLALVRGALSDVLSPDTVTRMRAVAPQMAVAEVPNVGHAPMLTEPAARAAMAHLLAEAP